MWPLGASDDIGDLSQHGGVDLVPSGVGEFDDLSAAVSKLPDEFSGHLGRDHRILVAVGDNDQRPGQVRLGRIREG